MLVVITAISVALYVIAHVERFRPCVRLIPIAISAGLFALGRADLLMHRAGAYIAAIEREVLVAENVTWEAFKATQTSTRLLPVYDLLGLSLWIYLFVWAELAVWRMSRTARERLIYLTLTLVLAALAVGSIVIGAST